MKMKRFISAALVLLLMAGLPVTALGANWYLEDGEITISATEAGQTVTQGTQAGVTDAAPVITSRDSSTPTENTITVTTADGATAEFTIRDVNIQTVYNGSAPNCAIEIVDSSAEITLEGENRLSSGAGSAIHVSGGNLTITGSGTLLADSSGEDDATIGSIAGETMSGSITIEGDVQVEAVNHNQGVGIGSGSYGDLTGSIAIGGNARVVALGDDDSAGIGAGDDGLFSGQITIDGQADVTAKAGRYVDNDASGIGTSDDGHFTGSITIAGNATVLAQGCNEGCGIGTADDERMEGMILIRDQANVTAYAGDLGAAIGSEDSGDMDGAILILGQAVVTTGIVDDDLQLIPGEIGYIGGDHISDHDSPNGNYIFGPGVTINGIAGDDIEALDEFVDLYHGDPQNLTILDVGSAGGQFYAELKNGIGAVEKILYGGSETVPTQPGSYPVTCVLRLDDTKVIEFEIGVLVIPEPTAAPLYRVTDQDGRDAGYRAEWEGSVLTITTDLDFAILTGRLSGMEILQRQGVETVVFVTNGAASTFQIADLLAMGESGEYYELTHDGEVVSFTLGTEKTDISDILLPA